MNPTWKTIPEMLRTQALKFDQRRVLMEKQAGAYRPISWKELLTQVQNTALGLLDLGVAQGDRVAILAENRPEWVYADLAILSVGGVTVPIYTSLTSDEIEYILKNAGARVIFISDPHLMTKVLSFMDALDLKVILLDAPYRVSGPRVWWLGELLGVGKTSGPESQEILSQRLKQIQSSDLASIIYTSGTTGPPKGVMLTHENFLSNCRAVREALPLGSNDVTLSFLPLSHVFERMAGYYFVLSMGGTVAYAQNMDTVPKNLLEVHPTILIGVPRFYEKFYDRIHQTVRSAPTLQRRIFHWALAIGKRWSKLKLAASSVPAWLAFQYWIANLLVFSKLRVRLGGKLRFCVSGGAPLSKELAEFFYTVGVLILEGYGLTETSPVITVNREDRFRFGSVGLLLPGVEVKIAEDGEILTRGPHVMRGYFNNKQATDEMIDSGGWLYTGDVGTLSKEGFLTITDRKKDLIKTSGGKMVAPQNLENQLKRDPFIDDCVVIGDRRKYLTALVIPNLAQLEAFAKEQNLSYVNVDALVKLEPVLRLIEERVERLNNQLASFEQLKKITLLAQAFSLGSGELTPTLKVKRKVVTERYAALIDAMYPD